MHPLLPIILNQAATVLLGIVYLKLSTKFIPPEVYGPYGNFLTLTQVGVLVTHSGLTNHTMRYWQRECSHAGTYARFLLGSSLGILNYLGPLLLGVTLALAWFKRDAVWLWTFPLLAFSNLVLALNQIGTGALSAGRNFWGVFWLTLSGTAARTFLPIGLALGTSMTLLILGLGYTAHALLILACLWALFRGATGAPLPSDATRSQWVRELKDYGRPFIVLGAGAWLLQFADRWVVESFFGPEQTGYFVIASGLGAIIPTIITTGLLQWVFPDIFKKSDEARTREDWHRIARRCDQITAVFLVLTVGGLLFLKVGSPYLVGWLISEKYLPALGMLVPAGLAMGTSQVNQFYYLLLQGQHNSAGMVWVMIAVSGVKTIGSIVAAAISWDAFANWLMLSVAVSGLLGRFLIRRMALAG